LSPHFFASQSTRQSNDLVALDRDVVVKDEGIGETGPVEGAIDFGRDNGFAVAVGDVDDLEGDLGLEDLAVTPGLDGGGAAELPAYVVDNGTVAEQGDERGGIVVVDRPDVGGDSPG